ncbi:MAG: hypothetical protein ABJA98_01545 [Acidobacteriota bacterium]
MESEYLRTINRLAKWRTVFAGRWLGTRIATDSEAIAVRDFAEKYLVLRVEVTALVVLLERAGIFITGQFENQIIKECDYLQRQLEQQFPGFKATDDGMHVDTARAVETTKGWPK